MLARICRYFVGMISIRQCLAIMHAGDKFSLKVVQYDRRRKEKRGKVLEVLCAELVWGEGGKDKITKKGERPPTELEKALSGASAAIAGRNPDHSQHYTRNIRVIVDGLKTEVIYKIHPALIIEFNGQPTVA